MKLKEKKGEKAVRKKRGKNGGLVFLLSYCFHVFTLVAKPVVGPVYTSRTTQYVDPQYVRDCSYAVY